MKPKVYVESSIIGYLVGRPSRDVITAAHQKLTHQWWERRRPAFEIFVSSVVLEECAEGDRDAARRRLAIAEKIPALEARQDALALARFLVRRRVVPAKAATDAVHIAVAAIHGMAFLLTWNCRHIANAQVRFLVEELLRSRGLNPPVLCTPEELMEG